MTLQFHYALEIYIDHSNDLRSVNPATDCAPLLPANDPIRGWCANNHTKLNTDNSRVITFTKKKKNVFNCSYKLCDEHITSNDSMKDLGVLLDSKPFFSIAMLN